MPSFGRLLNAVRNRAGSVIVSLRPPKISLLNGKNKNGPRIVFIAQRFEYGSPLNGAGYEFRRFAPALCRLASDVIFVPIESLRHGMKVLREGAINSSSRTPVISVFQDTAQIPRDFFLLPRNRFRLINWYTDDDMQFDSFSKHIARNFDLNVTTYARNIERYRAIGAPVHASQWAGLDGVSFDNERRFLACFIGRMYGRRIELATSLRAKFGNSVFIHDTRFGHLKEEEMVNAYRASLLAIDEATSYKGENLQIKARIFENASMGCAVLTNKNPLIEKYFEPGKEILFYRSQNELLDIASDAQARPEHYLRIARNAYDRCIREHTYCNRFAEILAIAGRP